jgi:membrane protein YdbS with pleckstrin-like domain
MLVTGLAQTLGDPVRELTATSFWVKLALVLCCAAGTAWVARAAARRSPATPPTFAARLVALALVISWLLIPMLGRMIAYDKAIWGALSLRP